MRRSGHRPQRKSKCKPGTNLVRWRSIGAGPSKRDVERKGIAHLPDRADKSRNGMRLAELFFIGKLSDRTDRPFDRPFEDETRESVYVLVSRQRALNIEMRRTPVPALR